MPANHNEVEKRLWDAADRLRANSKLKSSEYSVPVLGLIFLRYDEIIWNEKALMNVRAYILDNPAKWETDKNNPASLWM